MICGLNGAVKSTLGKALACRAKGYQAAVCEGAFFLEV